MMAASVDNYTRTVNTLKVLLPLGALGLLSTLFLFSGEIDPSESIPYVELGVEQLAQDQRISQPYFAGVTEGGVAVSITGAAASPDPNDPAKATVTDLVARIETPAGLVVDATSPSAVLDSAAQTVEFGERTRVQGSNGVSVTSDTLVIDIQESSLETRSPVEAEGPFGMLRADRMVISRADPSAAHSFVFEGDVKLVYQDNTK